MSMVQVSDDDAFFKPEYIFPQFLMEFVSSGELKNKNIIGIRYASTKVSNPKQYTSACRTYICYVFPTSTNTDKNNIDEKTSKYFELKKTISGTDQNMFSYKLPESGFLFPNGYDNSFENDIIYVDDEFSLSYGGTRFCEIEVCLNADEIFKFSD